MLFSDLSEFSHYKHCDFNDTACLKRIQARISSIVPPDSIVGFEQFGKNKSNIGLKCDCPSGCREIVNTNAPPPSLLHKTYFYFRLTKTKFQRHKIEVVQANRRKSPEPATIEKFTEYEISPNGTVNKITKVMEVATLKIAFNQPTCTLYKRIVYMTWDHFLGMRY